MDFVFDFETLGKGADVALLSMAVVPFRFEDILRQNMERPPQERFSQLLEEGFYVKFDVEDQVRNYGRRIDKGTVKWWGEQGKEARKVLKPSKKDLKLKDAMESFSEYCEQVGILSDSQMYCRGQDFDAPILDSLYDAVGIDKPIRYWNYRDVRTVIQCWTFDRRGQIEDVGYEDIFVKHNALHDCAAAVCDMYEAFTVLPELLQEVMIEANRRIPF